MKSEQDAGLPNRETERDAPELNMAIDQARVLLNGIADWLDRPGSSIDRNALEKLRDGADALGQWSPGTLVDADSSDCTSSGSLVLDVSDLIGYFAHNRLPTGIQRVQAELLTNIAAADRGATLCCFSEARDCWVKVDTARFVELCAFSRAGGDAQEPRWRALIDALHGDNSAARPYEFSDGAILINVGTSWWLPNYFLYIRKLKSDHRIRYIPLVYDLIPLKMPDYCADELVCEFVNWFVGVLDHADMYMAISEASKRDLIEMAGEAGRPISPDDVVVVPLDADFRAQAVEDGPRRFHEPFVLLVSTIEARKNQLGVLSAWSHLIDRHGASAIPRLVLVGKRGFQSDLVLARLDSDRSLNERVTILSDVEDSLLQGLYRDCLFTIYPSYYEGWGLPVTESLCHGKVPLVADNTSLVEAGGPFAEYFKTGSSREMIGGLEKLIFDAAFRGNREATIRAQFRPRSWSAAAGDVRRAISQWAERGPAEWSAPKVVNNAYHSMRRIVIPRIWTGIGTAEAFRSGLGWYRMEDHGCWTNLFGGADLELCLSESGVRRIGLQLVSPPNLQAIYRISVVGFDVEQAGLIQNFQKKWVFLDFPETVRQKMIRIHIDTSLVYRDNVLLADTRKLGVGLIGFYVSDDRPGSRVEFLESVAFGGLDNIDAYADRSFHEEIFVQEEGSYHNHAF